MSFLKHTLMLFFVVTSLYAQDASKTLIIGVDPFSAPFVNQGGRKELYGYDISMMNSLCKIMNRQCTFQAMQWANLFPSIMNNQIDLAASSITITLNRAKLITFSIPYGLSYSRLLTTSDMAIPLPFSIDALRGKKIGVEQGTIYQDDASQMGIKDPIIVPFANDDDSLAALSNKKVDYVLLDNPTALYWAANSSGTFKVVGKPQAFGFGIGIAVSPANIQMLPTLNNAITQYLNSKEYQINYNRFLEEF